MKQTTLGPAPSTGRPPWGAFQALIAPRVGQSTAEWRKERVVGHRRLRPADDCFTHEAAGRQPAGVGAARPQPAITRSRPARFARRRAWSARSRSAWMDSSAVL